MVYTRPQDPPHWQPPPAEPRPFDWLPFLLSFLRRRWPSMAISLACVVTLALVYALSAPARFTAETQLLIDMARTDQLQQQSTPHDSLTLNSVLESQVQVLQSAGLARKAVARLGLDDREHFAAMPSSRVDALRALFRSLTGQQPALASTTVEKSIVASQQLLSMVAIRRIGQTYVIGINVTSPSASEAAWLANGLADTYLADELAAKEEGIRQASGWLEARIGELHNQALTADRAVQDYKAQHGIVGTDRGLMESQQLSELTSQLVSARTRAAAMLTRMQRIDSIMLTGPGTGNVSDGLDDKVIINLRQQYVDDDRRVTELTSKFGEGHLAVRDLRHEMTALQNSIQGELARIAESYKSDYEVARADEASAQTRLDQSVVSDTQTNSDLVMLRSLQSSADTFRTLYQNFLQRYTQAVQDQSFPVPEARVITRAVPPTRRSHPKTGVILALSVVLGGGLGFCIGFTREVLDRGIRNGAQVRASTGMNCVGLVPRLRAPPRRPGRSAAAIAASVLQVAPGDILRCVTDAPHSEFAQAIHALRLHIAHQRLHSREVQLIGCVASRRHAGASTMAANLAQLLARTAGSALLVDWDFVNAALSRKLIGERGPGWLDVLGRRCGFTGCVVHDPATRLDFLPVGSADDATFTFAQSEQIHELLATLRSRYSFVVIDVPTLTSVVDAHYAVHMLDALVVVAEWGRAEPVPLAENLARIGLDAGNVLGVALNKASLKQKWRDTSPVAEHVRA